MSGLTRVGKGWNGHLQDVPCPLQPALLQVPELRHSDQPSAGLELRPRRDGRVERKPWARREVRPRERAEGGRGARLHGD